MRTARVIAGAERDYELLPVVVPVAGRLPSPTGKASSQPLIVELGDPGELRSGSVELLVDPVWRARLERTQPLPRLARAASPAWATAATRQIVAAYPSAVHGVALHAMRSYLAPLAIAIAERLGSPWATLDLDDDDVTFEAAQGDRAEADAFDRLLRTFVPLFSRVAVASPRDASGLSERYGFDVDTIPNTVAIPSATTSDRPGRSGLLFVGNLTYAPNVEAVQRLASSVIPGLRRALDIPVTATLVGAFDPDGPLASLREQEGVHLTGAVPDVSPYYWRASAVVAPLPPGGGTKIKVLEAFAHRVPVVTTPSGAAGLGVTHGAQLLIGHDPDELVRYSAELLGDPTLGRQLADRALDYVRTHHAPSVGDRAVRRFLADASRVGIRPDRVFG